jgi:hypothetical protein
MDGINTVTLDILDASIPDEFNKWQAYSDEVRFAHYKEEIRTDPTSWKRHKPDDWAFNLSWAEFRYKDVKDAAILRTIITSTQPGIYIFYIRPDKVLYHFPQFALYVGISNEKNSKRALRERLKDYLPSAVAGKSRREHIDRMLKLYYGVIWVAYALTDRPSAELSALEEKLHGFIYPRYDRRDFPVDIKTQQKRFGEI